MTQCSYTLEHARHGQLRCAAPAEDRTARCVQHRRGRHPSGLSLEPQGETTLVVRDGCVIWDALAAYHQARRGRKAADLFATSARPLAWMGSLGLWVDVVAWVFLEEFGRVRPAGTFQRCGTPGCVAPEHAMEPRRQVARSRIDVSTALDRRFGLGAA